jgi:hypothetical protein
MCWYFCITQQCETRGGDTFGVEIVEETMKGTNIRILKYRGADKSLAGPGRKQATATEDFDVHMSYL